MRQVGPGVKDLAEGDVVLPTIPLLGTWTEAAIAQAKHVVKVGKLGVSDAVDTGKVQSAGGLKSQLYSSAPAYDL